MSTRRVSVSLLRALGVAAVLCGTVLLAGIVFPGIVARHVAPVFLYLPGAGSGAARPADHDLARAEEVRLAASDGVRLHGWWIPGSGAARCGTVLFLHGNAGSVAGRAAIAGRLSSRGFDAFLVDYRGYGRSEGRPSEEGLYRDARAAWAYVVEERGVAPSRLAVAGNSLGSAVAAHLASRRRSGAVVLTGAFTSVPELGAEIYRWLPGILFTGWPSERFETERWIRNVRAPVLVARGGADRLVPRSQSRRVHDAAGPGAAWYEAPGASHDGLWADDGFWARLVPFLEEALGCP